LGNLVGGKHLLPVLPLLWEQCTELMQQKLLGIKEFQSLSKINDGLGLLKAIKATTYLFEGKQHPPHALYAARRRFYMCY
jgi:hypothetical protein